MAPWPGTGRPRPPWLATGLGALLAALLGCRNETSRAAWPPARLSGMAAGTRDHGPPRPRGQCRPRSQGSDPEAAAYERLRRDFGRPAPDRRHIREWTERQAAAISAHLAAYPDSPRVFQLCQWLLVGEIEVLGRYERAERLLDALESRIEKNPRGPGAEGAARRALRLRTTLYRRWNRPDREIAALRRLLPRVQGAERRLVAGRLDTLVRLRPGAGLPEVRGRSLDGRVITPALWSGKVLLLDFWDPVDPGAAADLRDRLLAREAFGDAGFVLVGVPLCRSLPAVKRCLAAAGADWPQLFDPRRPGNDHPLARRFTPGGRSTSFLVDRQGVIRQRDLRGRRLLETIEKLVREAVGSRG